MDKIKELQKLKELLDSGVLNETEFNSMKSDLINSGEQIKKEEKQQDVYDNLEIKEDVKSTKTEQGNLHIKFEGQWFLIDCKTKIFLDNELIATQSTKKGFDVKVPLKSNQITLKIVLAGLKSTIFKIEEIETYKSYSLILRYDDSWGKYSKNFDLIEHD